ncbi:MAG TPA: hypothetical protein VMV25_13420 [Steroidobacteraceae bacterium]|nr:hypothetical protein [Steroidobacteraceae bacterium]
MALLAEEIVEEWLNRQGYFTIRGIKVGVHEIDLLAIRHSAAGLECRHLEVQASVRPVSYITRVPLEVQKSTGRSATSSKTRSDEELRQGIREWIAKKFERPSKIQIRNQLAPGPWSRELVVHKVYHAHELELIAKTGITVHQLMHVVAKLNAEGRVIQGAAGAHLTDLVALAMHAK